MTTFSENYPYPELVTQLQFLCDPLKYQQIIDKYPGKSPTYPLLNIQKTTDYWEIIPQYAFAQCPICGVRCSQPMDTYNLSGWDWFNDLRSWLYQESTLMPCGHFLGTHKFINLHNQEPTEIDYLSNATGEAPRLSPWFLPDDVPSYVVLHALPICRIVEEKFVPSYTLFVLTYFSEDPKLLLKRHYQAQAEFGQGDPDFYATTVTQPALYKTDVDKIPESYYELEKKAQEGKFGWLDFSQPGLPLSIGTGNQLPRIYRSIEGKRYKYVWRNH